MYSSSMAKLFWSKILNLSGQHQTWLLRSAGLLYDALQIFHHGHPRGNEKKAIDSEAQNHFQLNSTLEIVDCFPEKESSAFIKNTHYLAIVCLSIAGDLHVTRSMVCDSSTTFLDYQEQNTFFSSHLLNWRIVLKDILVEWFEPKLCAWDEQMKMNKTEYFLSSNRTRLKSCNTK